MRADLAERDRGRCHAVKKQNEKWGSYASTVVVGTGVADKPVG